MAQEVIEASPQPIEQDAILVVDNVKKHFMVGGIGRHAGAGGGRQRSRLERTTVCVRVRHGGQHPGLQRVHGHVATGPRSQAEPDFSFIICHTSSNAFWTQSQHRRLQVHVNGHSQLDASLEF